MRICFCIPTYNRAQKLLATLQNLEKYSQLTTHQIHIYVSNNCSNDDTALVLEEFSNKNAILSYKNRDTFITTGHYSAIELITEVPENYDWYWLFGDDDYIIEENAKSLDATFLRNDISYIYAPVAGDVLNNFEIDTVPNLVEKYGFIQLLSFISSQIINHHALQNARKIIANSTEIDVRNLFAHSFVLYEALLELNGCIHPNVVSDTYPERGGDWKFIDWIYTSKYLAKTIDAHYLQRRCPVSFFKYREKIIWRWYFSCVMRFIFSLGKTRSRYEVITVH